MVLQDNGMRVVRVPGMAIYYNEHLDGVPETFKRFLQKTPVLHSSIVFLTVRQVISTLLQRGIFGDLIKVL